MFSLFTIISAKTIKHTNTDRVFNFVKSVSINNILIDYISEINMERGYLGTTATTHAQGATVTLRTYIKKNGILLDFSYTTHAYNKPSINYISIYWCIFR